MTKYFSATTFSKEKLEIVTFSQRLPGMCSVKIASAEEFAVNVHET